VAEISKKSLAERSIRERGHYPFGEVWYQSGTNPPVVFTSYYRDSAAGLDYAVNRYYSYRIGRFMTPDPIAGFIPDPQTLNRYPYVINDPVNLVDPLGLCWWLPCPSGCTRVRDPTEHCYCLCLTIAESRDSRGDCFLSFWGPGCVEGLGHHIGPVGILQLPPGGPKQLSNPQDRQKMLEYCRCEPY